MSSGTNTVDDFKTPERTASPKLRRGVKAPKQSLSLKDKETEQKMAEVAKPNTVTPNDAGSRETTGEKESPMQMSFPKVESPDATDHDKHVRFNSGGDDENNTPAAVDETSTEDSPSGSKRGLVSRRGGRCGSPSRVSSSAAAAAASKQSGATNEQPVLEFKTYRSPPRKKREDAETSSIKDDALKDVGKDGLEKQATKPAPLHSSQDSSSSKAETPKKNSVTFSPVPPKKEFADRANKTPTKSPARKFQSLPNLDDSNVQSPVPGLFLSPHPATPAQYRTLEGAGKEKSDRFMATPTDFTLDYGKSPRAGADSSGSKSEPLIIISPLVSLVNIMNSLEFSPSLLFHQLCLGFNHLPPMAYFHLAGVSVPL